MSNLVKAKDLQIGDVVKPIHWNPMPFDTCIVKQVKDGMITLFRPYGTTADFTYTAGVICYTGTEEYSIYMDDTEYALLEHRLVT